jgi:hypothetical protein
MKLFPQSEQWVCKTLINPTTNEINQHWINRINTYIALTTNKHLSDWTFDEFVILLNGILSLNPNETEEMVLFKNEIINWTITGNIQVPYINNWDLCGLLLIIKKIKDEKLTTCENPLDLISDILTQLRPEMYILDEDFAFEEFMSAYFPENFTYSQIENDEFMNGFFYNILYDEEQEITIADILSNANYPSFLLLNDSFKKLCYENVYSERAYSVLPEEIKNDINFIRILLKNNGNALEFLSNEHKSNKELVLIAVEEDGGWAFRFAADELKNDREFIITCLERSRKTQLRFFLHNFKSDRELVLLAVQRNGAALEYASLDFQSDKEIVTLSITDDNKGEALKFAAKELQDDREFIIATININAEILKFVSDNFKGNRDFIIEVVSKNGLALEYIDKNLIGNRKIVLASVTNNGLALQFAPEELKSDEDIVYQAVFQNGLALQYASEELKNNREFINRINNI